MEQRREGKQTREEKGGKTGSEESEREERREKEKQKEKKKKEKIKVVQFFLRCFDGQSFVARELNLVYSTRTSSRY